MQGEALRKLRNYVMHSQGAFAGELGLTPQFVGMMERDEKAIERRTELAAQHVALIHTATVHHDAELDRPSESDIALRDAMFLWDPVVEGIPPLKVVAHGNDDRRYEASWGACNAGWREFDDVGRLFELFRFLHQIAVLDCVPPVEATKACMVIPEFRGAVVPEIRMRHADDNWPTLTRRQRFEARS